MKKILFKVMFICVLASIIDVAEFSSESISWSAGIKIMVVIYSVFFPCLLALIMTEEEKKSQPTVIGKAHR